MTAAPLVEVRHLTRDYGMRGAGGVLPKRVLRAADDVSFSIARGAILGIVGESGSGKSTVARIVMALDRPTSGDVLFEGDALFKLSTRDLRRRRRDFQMVFQDPYGSLDPRHSVGRIIAEPLHLLENRLRTDEQAVRVAQTLEEVGLNAADAKRYPHEFSGGQRQRIAIARALITRPKLVVADEAVSALDLSVQAQILKLILDLRERNGLTVLFISHNLGVIEEIADQVGVMYGGKLIEIGATRDVLHRPQHDYTRRLLDAEPTLDRIGRRGRRPATAESSGAAS
jgi:peptide/nickel transport system ATP-binding protein